MPPPLIETPEAANRLARASCSDIALYNEEKIKLGIERDSFFDLLKPELDEGREHYNARVSPALRARTNFFERAIVDVILYRKRHLRSPIW